jgi:CheY-like chemotaxis protein
MTLRGKHALVTGGSRRIGQRTRPFDGPRVPPGSFFWTRSAPVRMSDIAERARNLLAEAVELDLCYDLILSDTKMPILDGLALYREIERRFPSLRGRVIFVTGDVLDEEKQRFLAATGAPVITKPFDLNDVRVAVRRRLADADARRGEGG